MCWAPFFSFLFLHESRRGCRSVFSYQTVSCFLQNIPYEIDSWCLAVGIEPIKPVSCLFLTSDQPYKEFSCKFSHLIFRAEHLGVCSEILPAPLFFPCLFFPEWSGLQHCCQQQRQGGWGVFSFLPPAAKRAACHLLFNAVNWTLKWFDKDFFFVNRVLAFCFSFSNNLGHFSVIYSNCMCWFCRMLLCKLNIN